MEYLDIYDENQNHLGVQERSIVHRDALWHKTVHCWLYDKDGNVFFQIRKDEGTLYTTASGHLQAGESVKEGFGREVKEEIGTIVDYEKAVLVDVVKFTLDKVKKDGSIFKDRAFANVYTCIFNGEYSDFNYDEQELDGLVKVSARKALQLFTNGKGKISGIIIKKIDGKIISNESQIKFEDFLVNSGETALSKYGQVLNKIIYLTNN